MIRMLLKIKNVPSYSGAFFIFLHILELLLSSAQCKTPEPLIVSLSHNLYLLSRNLYFSLSGSDTVSRSSFHYLWEVYFMEQRPIFSLDIKCIGLWNVLLKVCWISSLSLLVFLFPLLRVFAWYMCSFVLSLKYF